MKEDSTLPPFESWRTPMHLGPWVLLGLVRENERYLMFEAKDRGMNRPVFLVFSPEGQEALLELNESWGRFSGPPLPRVLRLAQVEGPGGETLHCLVLEGSQGGTPSREIKRSSWLALGHALCLAMQELLDLGLEYTQFQLEDLRLEGEGELFLLPPFPGTSTEGFRASGPRAVRAIAGVLIQGLIPGRASRRGEAFPDLGQLPSDLRFVLGNCLKREGAGVYSSPRDLGLDLWKILRHEPIPSPPREFRRRLLRFSEYFLAGSVLFLFALGGVRLFEAREKVLVLEEKRTERFGSLLGDLQADLKKGHFESAARILGAMEEMKLAKGETLLERARGDFQRSLHGRFGELLALSEGKTSLFRLRSLAKGLSLLEWGGSRLQPPPRGRFLARILGAKKKAEDARVLLRSLPALSSFLEERSDRGRGRNSRLLGRQFREFCQREGDRIPFALGVLQELREGLQPLPALLLLDVFLSLPGKRRLEWARRWLPKAKPEEILFVSLASGFRDRKGALPLLDRILGYLEEKQEAILHGDYLFGIKNQNRVSLALRRQFSSTETWAFWGRHYPLFEAANASYPTTVGSAILLLRGILDPQGTRPLWRNWVKRGDLRVLFHPEFCTDPILLEEAKRFTRLCLLPKAGSREIPLLWPAPRFQTYAPLALFHFFASRPREFPLKDPSRRRLFWEKVFESLSENGGIGYRSFPLLFSFPEKDWVPPFFQRVLRFHRGRRSSLWKFYFQGRGMDPLFRCLTRREAISLVEPQVARILLSRQFLDQKFCLALLMKGREKGLLSKAWAPRLRSYLSRVASPYLKSMALECLEGMGAVELRTFLKLRDSSLPSVRKRAWAWLFRKDHLEKAWDFLGGEQVPPQLLPDPQTVGIVSKLFRRMNRKGKDAGPGGGAGGPPLLTSRRGHYFKALESLRNR